MGSINKVLHELLWLLFLLSCIGLKYGVSSAKIADQPHKRRRLSDETDGFISIDCGINQGNEYTDPYTQIHYVSDKTFIHTGVNGQIANEYKYDKVKNKPYSEQFSTIRYFPKGKKNCYTLRPHSGKDHSYLVRAVFMYGNYDSKNTPPQFDLLIGADLWTTIKLDNNSHIEVKEIIHTPLHDPMYVCLGNTGDGTPFISTLELRPLNDSLYPSKSGSLVKSWRQYVYNSSGDHIRRYNEDVYDRIWQPMRFPEYKVINNVSDMEFTENEYKVPSYVMMRAIKPKDDKESLNVLYPFGNSTAQFYVYLHFVELEMPNGDEAREFNISIGTESLGVRKLHESNVMTVWNPNPVSGSTININLQRISGSSLPPILNAFEIYMVKQLSQASTKGSDADAMQGIKSDYKLSIWQGDPCTPQNYPPWDGVNCSFQNTDSPRILSVNLSSRDLMGVISASFSDITSLEVLDLSNNRLTGEIPESLANLASLRYLNLAGNKLDGQVPQPLLKKWKEGSLHLSWCDNEDLHPTASCKKEKKRMIVIIAASIGSVFTLAAALCFLVLVRKRRQRQVTLRKPAYNKSKRGLAKFSYSEVVIMTKHLEVQLGKGAFGIVYYGCLKDGTKVAVKQLYPSINGSEEFSTEVELLMGIRHKNLVSLVGYCDDAGKLVLIYEYMANGNLQQNLSAFSCTLIWKQRIQVAIDAAQGLDYLHNGCRPPIVHRDVKTANILLNENFQAKVADFGLSKIFPDDDSSHISTRIVGTPGYLDPEYYTTQRLSEKSDVYSFGIVLLELITGQPSIIKNLVSGATNLVNKVIPLLENGDLWSIVDPRMTDLIKNPNSVWRAIDVAMACTKTTAIERPTMSRIVNELNECFAMELDDGGEGGSMDSKLRTSPLDLTEFSPVVPPTALHPGAR